MVVHVFNLRVMEGITTQAIIPMRCFFTCFPAKKTKDDTTRDLDMDLDPHEPLQLWASLNIYSMPLAEIN